MPFKVLDHTADFMVEVQATDMRELFAEAARSMVAILTDPKTVEGTQALIVEVEAENLEQLLVTWLTELIFRHETELWLFSEFEIRAMTETRLQAKVWGEKLDPERHPIDREIKAVTYHRLGIEEEDGGFRTKIVFDL
jgi:SHS2 domain-containing protein